MREFVELFIIETNQYLMCFDLFFVVSTEIITEHLKENLKEQIKASHYTIKSVNTVLEKHI